MKEFYQAKSPKKRILSSQTQIKEYTLLDSSLPKFGMNLSKFGIDFKIKQFNSVSVFKTKLT